MGKTKNEEKMQNFQLLGKMYWKIEAREAKFVKNFHRKKKYRSGFSI